MKSERGSTLLQVLLVITIFTVIGFSLIGTVVGEGKRMSKTELHVQARTTAESGLTYFEADFKKFIKDSTIGGNKGVTVDDMRKFLNNEGYLKSTGKIINDEEDSSEIQITVKLPDRTKIDKSRQTLEVTSKEIDGTSDKALVGYYKMDFKADFEEPTNKLATFESNVKKVDFSEASVLDLGLFNILDAELIKLYGREDKFYPIPDDSYINVGLLRSILLDLDLGGLLGGLLGKAFGKEINRFQTMENNSVVAVKDARVLNLGLLETGQYNLISLNVINLPERDNVNVLINGSYRSLGLLGATLLGGYQDIKFKKLGVAGNVIIQKNERTFSNNNIARDSDDERGFYFNNGLFVGKSLLVGGDKQKESNLNLSGDMAVMAGLYMDNLNLKINDSNIYVDGKNHIDLSKPTVEIKNTCIESENKNFHLFSTGKVYLNFDKNNCKSFDGLYFSDESITIDTDGKDIEIYGELFGDVIVEGGGSVTVKNEGDYSFYTDVKFKDIKLIPQGRSFTSNEEK